VKQIIIALKQENENLLRHFQTMLKRQSRYKRNRASQAGEKLRKLFFVRAIILLVLARNCWQFIDIVKKSNHCRSDKARDAAFVREQFLKRLHVHISNYEVTCFSESARFLPRTASVFCFEFRDFSDV